MSNRAKVVYIQKLVIAISAIAIVLIVILFGSRISAFAGASHDADQLYTYYTSIELEQGDTLWDIAQEYTFGTGISAQDYIDEVCAINHLSDAGSIHEGRHIVIPYYTYESQ